MLKLSIDIIEKFLMQMKTDPELTRMIKHYLQGQGKKTMRSIYQGARYKQLAEVHNSLG